ncbi:hypothetical protein ACLOJK_032842 [Asimina triloba]
MGVDCLPSGSISFGQFDEESLCWERRSSFSRNRYLEEVEKYSRPGSVVEKKAYFEAHFKRKALLLQAASSECQNGMGLQASTIDTVDDVNYMEDFEHSDNEATHAQCKTGLECKTSENNIADDLNITEDFEINGDEENHYCQYEKTPDGSDEEHEHMVANHEVEDISPSGTATVSRDTKNVKPEETVTDQAGFNTLLLISDDSEVKLERKLESEASILKSEEDQKCTSEEEISITDPGHMHTGQAEISITDPGQIRTGEAEISITDPGHMYTGQAEISITEAAQKRSSEAEISITGEEQNYTDKAETSIPRAEQKRTNETDGSNFGVDHSEVKQMENVYGSLEKTDKMTKSSKNGMDHASDVKNGQKPSLNVNAKLELQSTKPKARTQVSGAQIFPKKMNEKTCLSSAKTSGKTPVKIDKEISITKRERQSPRKAPPTLLALQKSMKPETLTQIFSVQFYLKLEEKQHAKEAEMSQLQARTQEETEARIKQLRKSLNFKATPMPSFYNETGPLSSKGEKDVMSREKSPKLQSKPLSSGQRVSAPDKSQTLTKNGKQGLQPTGKPAANTHPQTLEAKDSNATSEANVNCQTLIKRTNESEGTGSQNYALEAIKQTRMGKKERNKGKPSSATQCQDGDATSKVKEGERAKQKRPGVSRKVMKDVVDRSSDVDRLAVHVAS